MASAPEPIEAEITAPLVGDEVVAEVAPKGPFSLALSAMGANDSCRRFRHGVVTALLETEAGPEIARAHQRCDGTLVLRAATRQGLELLRFELALDDDHTTFLERFAGDPLIGRSTRFLRGLRPIRFATVAHSLLRAVCAQLITAREARTIEARIIRRVSPRDPGSGLCAPPTRERLSAVSPAELCRLGLASKRAGALARICRTLDLERLRSLPENDVAARLARERSIGPWSLGVISLRGLGGFGYGLSGDLELIKLLSAIEGRWVSEAETGELLARYGEWAGLASFYLIHGAREGLVPIRRGGGYELAARAARLRRAIDSAG
jgi:3-methyladenine DNA glycosylase/8-oxoguanine DNA glycosylase